MAEGSFRLHHKFALQFLSTPRDLIVYLPPGYEQSSASFPVLYLQDGQNLFDPATAFNGQTWRADAITDELICRGEIRPVILVGIYNTGVRRVSEYTPTRDRRSGKGGKAARYAQMLVREIKPFIAHEYRTSKGPADTGTGALVSLVAVLDYPQVFGQVALMSPFRLVGRPVHFECSERLSIPPAGGFGSTLARPKEQIRSRSSKMRVSSAIRCWREAGATSSTSKTKVPLIRRPPGPGGSVRS
jgi:hypothetical protein